MYVLPLGQMAATCPSVSNQPSEAVSVCRCREPVEEPASVPAVPSAPARWYMLQRPPHPALLPGSCVMTAGGCCFLLGVQVFGGRPDAEGPGQHDRRAAWIGGGVWVRHQPQRGCVLPGDGGRDICPHHPNPGCMLCQRAQPRSRHWLWLRGQRSCH